jgi:hypothetical protein
MISLTPLKDELRRSRAPGDPAREVLLAEPDQVTPEAYSAKLRGWLVLLSLEDTRELGGPAAARTARGMEADARGDDTRS